MPPSSHPRPLWFYGTIMAARVIKIYPSTLFLSVSELPPRWNGPFCRRHWEEMDHMCLPHYPSHSPSLFVVSFVGLSRPDNIPELLLSLPYLGSCWVLCNSLVVARQSDTEHYSLFHLFFFTTCVHLSVLCVHSISQHSLVPCLPIC